MFIFENISIPHSQTLRVRRDRYVYITRPEQDQDWGAGLKGTQYSENVLPQTFRLDTCVYTQSHFLTSFADIYCYGSTQLEHALGRSKVPSWPGAVKQAQCQP